MATWRHSSSIDFESVPGAWQDFKEFTYSAAHSVIIHALTVIRLHYPLVKPEVTGTGFACGMSLDKITKLEDETEEAAAKLVGDVDLFGEERSNTE